MLPKNKQTLLYYTKLKGNTIKSKKLLDEKLEGLIRSFRESVVEGYKIENEVKKIAKGSIGEFLEATNFVTMSKLRNYALARLTDKSTAPYSLTAQTKKYFGVSISYLEVKMKKLELESSIKPVIARSMKDFNRTIPLFIQLAQIQIKCEVLAEEINKTNRLIANIEQKIDTMTQTIRSIKSALQERENEAKAVLIKLFT